MMARLLTCAVLNLCLLTGGVALAEASAAPAAAAPAAAAPAAAEPPATAPATDSLTAQQLFEAGNAAYYQGEYDEAARVYGRALADHQVEDPVLYHNIGNAYFRTGAFGSAILYYRRGLELDATAELTASLRNNLQVTRQALRERYAAESDGSQFIYAEPGGVFFRITHLLSEGALSALFLLLAALLAGLLAAYRIRGDGKGYGAAAIPVAVIVGLLGIVLAGRVAADMSFRVGVVIADEVTLREGPHPDARGVAIPEGMEVRVVENTDGWTRVELSSGREGWVDEAVIKQI